ncbi:MAG: diaminopimelate epimerase [Thermodesulfovibrionales bacterium]|nr:diaminopimelate epimerase [Thermodesulfovibrionales bacterium]
MLINFTKMHGLGNDFILIDCYSYAINPSYFNEIYIKKLCHRRFGIGADQLLLLEKSNKADFKMRIFNADGSEVEMCGNGIRCFAKYIWDKKLSTNPILKIETLAGIIMPEKVDGLIKVDMGEPAFESQLIPTTMSPHSQYVIDQPLLIIDRNFYITCVSMGNPHAVIFLDEDISSFPIETYGPKIEKHTFFPKKTNVEFVNLINKNELKMRVWERGSGETMACGTGASAVAVAAMKKNLTERKVTVHLLGGDLIIEWADNNHVFMIGPASKVFEGILDLKEF